MGGFSLGFGLAQNRDRIAVALLVWLLATGVWNDAGAWDDAANWKDI